MDIQKNWWELTLCGSQLVRESIESLETGISVALTGKTVLPWASFYYDKLKGATISSTKTFDFVNDKDIENPGDFILEKYCTHDVQSQFWPEPPNYLQAEFLAETNGTLLNHRFIVVRNFTSEKRFLTWCDFSSRYIKRSKQIGKEGSEYGTFILDAAGMVDSYDSTYIKSLSLAPRDVDLLTYNLLNTSETYNNYVLNRYAAEFISELCDYNLELSGFLAQRDDLISSPVKAYTFCCDNVGITDNRATDEQVLSAAIMAQYKVLFPLIEQRRHDIIIKYYDSILKCLPWKNDYSEMKSAPFDMELRDLVFKSDEFGLSKEDKITAVALRDVRNQLAHSHLLTYGEICVLIDQIKITK